MLWASLPVENFGTWQVALATVARLYAGFFPWAAPWLRGQNFAHMESIPLPPMACAAGQPARVPPLWDPYPQALALHLRERSEPLLRYTLRLCSPP